MLQQKNNQPLPLVSRLYCAILCTTFCIVLAAFPVSASAQSAEPEETAWEYRPYQIAVWLCSDGSPDIEANLDRIADELVLGARRIDASGWYLNVQQPPRQLQWKILSTISAPEAYTESLADDPLVGQQDKLMCVCLSSENGQILARVRELDLETRQWGPLGERNFSQTTGLLDGLVQLVKNAFMPIAEVERVTEHTLENGKKADMVYLRARAIRTCKRSRQVVNDREIPGDGLDNDDNGSIDDMFAWASEPINDSPVWVRDSDRFLPVIRRTDRQGNLVRLDPVEFTYLTIEGKEDTKFVCAIQSYHRAPLAGRKSKRARKLALVIRPPESSTTLKLVSRGDDPQPLEGYEIRSGHPGATVDEIEVLGYTDWRGMIEIPPSERGMRLLLVKHGDRRLMKLPMIPGLYATQVTAVPDDETRLYAEGVISGIETEILNLVAQRSVMEAEIEALLDEGRQDEARALILEYQELPSPQQIKNRLADERTALKIKTSDPRELDYINLMFDALSGVLSSRVMDSKESELRERMLNPGMPSPEPVEPDDSGDDIVDAQPKEVPPEETDPAEEPAEAVAPPAAPSRNRGRDFGRDR